MQFSEQRLRELVNPAVDTATLSHRLTMAGLEVDAILPVAPPFSGVMIGEVVDMAPHPDADKLRVTRVSIGLGEPLQIVCGAANVRPGLRIPVATVGALLPGDFRIQEATLRGVASFGMLCAEQELGLAEASDGLWELPADAPVGADLRQWLNLDDHLIELGLTPNRGDCLSLRGLARETAAIFGLPWTPADVPAVAASLPDVLPIRVVAPDACPRYAGRLIRGVRTGVTSPLWLVEALRRAGVRSLHPVVDITNHVMLTLGQPMHAFDAATLNGGVEVRHAWPGETLTLLDGQSVELREQTLVIADSQTPLALAGIMGGLSSAVGDATTDIFLEAAFFQPLALAGEARRYGLHTDASHRFERGVDPTLPAQAIELATALILALLGGQAGPVVDQVQADQLPKRSAITLRRSRIAQVLGFVPEDDAVVSGLVRLGMQVTASEAGWQVMPPAHRFDVAIEVDLIEEVARLHGYNNLPVKALHAALRLQPHSEARQSVRRLKRTLVDLGYQEAITFSFQSSSLQQVFDPELTPLVLANPISADLSTMRTSLWPGLALAARHNQSRQQARVRVFETGLRFLPTADGLQQSPFVAGLVTGSAWPEGWNNPKNSLDFFDVKGNIESLLQICALNGRVTFRADARHGLHPGQTASLWLDDRRVGWLGALHPHTQKQLDLDGTTFVFELALDVLDAGVLPRFAPLSRFPETRRDLALLVPDSTASDALLATVREASGEFLRDLQVFDVYRGSGVPAGSHSLALGLTWQHPERTLLDAEVQAWEAAVLSLLQTRWGVARRN